MGTYLNDFRSLCISLYFPEIYHFICSLFVILVYSSSTEFAEKKNLKVSLSRNRILLNFEEILVNKNQIRGLSGSIYAHIASFLWYLGFERINQQQKTFKTHDKYIGQKKLSPAGTFPQTKYENIRICLIVTIYKI